MIDSPTGNTTGTGREGGRGGSNSIFPKKLTSFGQGNGLIAVDLMP